MSRKLLRFTTLLAVAGGWPGAVAVAAVVGRGPNGWLHAKLVLVLVTHRLPLRVRRMLRRIARRGSRCAATAWYRWFNELPVLLLTRGRASWWWSSRF